MIVGACGYGGTGSSAVKDYLKEFNTTQIIDRAECQFAFKVDGLQDLEYHLMKQYSRQMSGDYAVKRFLDASGFAKTPYVKKIYLDKNAYLKITKEFIDSITQAEYKGFDNEDFETKYILKNMLILCFKKFVIPIYESQTKKLYSGWPMRKMRVCIKPENFYSAVKKYTDDLLTISGADFSKIVVLDQPFEGNNPEQSFVFFNDPYAIVVDRDPRDLYMASSYQWPDGTFMPRRDVKAFVEYYKQQRLNIDKGQNIRVLRINLEDMIFNYAETSKRINDFLGLEDAQHVDSLKYFNPERSIKGSQLYKKISGHDKEIQYIEEHLNNYLFPFENYSLSEKNTELNSGLDNEW